jgi:hypothetical protein
MEIIMIRLGFMFFGLLSFIGPVFGSEKKIELHTLKVSVCTLNNNLLYYRDSKYINYSNKTYGMECPDNDCFVQISCSPLVQGLPEDFIKSITLIPYNYFMHNNADPRKEAVAFKQRGSELFSFSTTVGNEEKKIQLILDVDLNNRNPQDWLVQFLNKPQCTSEDIKEALCKKGIISKKCIQRSWIEQLDRQFEGKSSDIYVQGPEGYFKELLKDIKMVEQKRQQKAKQEAALFWSRIKKFCGGSIAAILMYVLYQKFYTTAA